MSDFDVSGPGPRRSEVETVTLRSGADTWTNMPAALTEYLGVATYRFQIDLSNYTSCRLQVQVTTAAPAAAYLRLQYTVDLTGVAGWATLSPNCLLDAAGPAVSAYGDMPAAAQTVVLLRLVGVGGDGVVDPIIAGVFLNLTT